MSSDGHPNAHNERRRLTIPERAAVVILLALCASFFFIPLVTGSKPLPTIENRSTIDVTIDGAVISPGRYTLPRKSTLDELYALSGLLESARPRGDSKRKLIDGEWIVVPKARSLSVVLYGALDNPGTFSVDEGTRIDELISLLSLKLLPNADLRPLKKNRRVKEGEEIHIPFASEKPSRRSKK
ncbi:MAG: SLBB domain-containing protein [Chlamydiia bacterium]|nr:SLBB domain-containing protein [Chlamydiia bacterium]